MIYTVNNKQCSVDFKKDSVLVLICNLHTGVLFVLSLSFQLISKRILFWS